MRSTKKTTKLFFSVKQTIAAGFGLSLATSSSIGGQVYAQANKVKDGVDSLVSDNQEVVSASSAIENLINAFLFIVGGLAVVMVIYGGFKYITSGGDAQAVASAKNTIIYAVIGIAVAVLAYAITKFVYDAL